MESLILILALLFSLLVAILALANQAFVEVNYLFGRAEISLIILILGSASAGAVIVGLFSLFRGLRAALRFREARRSQEELQRKVEALHQENTLLAADLERLRAPQQQPQQAPAAPPPPPPVTAPDGEPSFEGETSGEGAAREPER